MKLSEYRAKEKEYKKTCLEYRKKLTALHEEYSNYQYSNRLYFFSDVMQPLIKEIKKELKIQDVFQRPYSESLDPLFHGTGVDYWVYFSDAGTLAPDRYELSVRLRDDGRVFIGGGVPIQGGWTNWKEVNEFELSDVISSLNPHGNVKPLQKPSLDARITDADSRTSAQPIYNKEEKQKEPEPTR